jgi:lactoylglutathione lyase
MSVESEQCVPTRVEGLFETHLNVRNLETSIQFYRDCLGLELAYVLPERSVAFFWLGGRGHAMLGVWETGSSPITMRVHLALTCSIEQVLAAPAALRAAGILPLGFNAEPVDEPVVFGWMPAVSVFFSDPDGHSLEYLAMLPDAPRPSAGVVPYSQWLALKKSP